MSNNLVVKKHGVEQNLQDVDAVQTYGANGGNVKWIPENESVLKGKFIDENGTYKAEDDGALGYTRVVVMDIASAGTNKEINAGKKLIAIKEGGIDRVMSAVKSIKMITDNSVLLNMVARKDIQTKTLSITEPGVYDIKDDVNKGDAVAYSQVTVNVSNEDRDAAGFNPSNPTWQDNLPDEIRVTTPPTKMEYAAGEEIDYTGMVVKAYKNGSVWSNANYPDGVIPHEELILPKLKNNVTVIIPRDKNAFGVGNPAYKLYKYDEVYSDFVQNCRLNADSEQQYVDLMQSESYYFLRHTDIVPGTVLDEEYGFSCSGTEKIYAISAAFDYGPDSVTVLLYSKAPFTVHEQVISVITTNQGITEEKHSYTWSSNPTWNDGGTIICHYYRIQYGPNGPIAGWNLVESYPDAGNATYQGSVYGISSLCVSFLYGRRGYLIQWNRPVDGRKLETMLFVQQ